MKRLLSNFDIFRTKSGLAGERKIISKNKLRIQTQNYHFKIEPQKFYNFKMNFSL